MPYRRRKYKVHDVYGVATGDLSNIPATGKRQKGQVKKKGKGRSKVGKYVKKHTSLKAARKGTREHTFNVINALHEVFGIPVTAPKTKNYKKVSSFFKGKKYHKRGKK